MSQRIAAILLFFLMPGCIIVDTGVTNPLPGMSRVAVVPFRNLTNHPDGVVDGRRFAMTYASELQKVPGYEVVPVGVTEIAMVESGLKFNSPNDLLKLAELLSVDAIAVGAVTDYDPYYPPRIGLQVEWLSPSPWKFSPGVPTDPRARKWQISAANEERKERRRAEKLARKRSFPFFAGLRQRLRMPAMFRGQSPDESDITEVTEGEDKDSDEMEDNWRPVDITAETTQVSAEQPIPVKTAIVETELPLPAELFQQPPRQIADESLPLPRATTAESTDDTTRFDGRPMLAAPAHSPLPQSSIGPENWPPGHLPTEPIMAYSRFFDGADADLVAELRDYAELNGDLRGGGWEGYLQRSDDFIRFVCHRMIEEMLTLHGGEGRRRIVVKFRKYK